MLGGSIPLVNNCVVVGMFRQVVYTNIEIVPTGVIDVTTSTMMDKGLVVIPKAIRDELGLKKGDRVIFVKLGKSVTFFPASKDPIKESRGILKGGGSMEDYLEEKRRELEEEEAGLPPPRTAK